MTRFALRSLGRWTLASGMALLALAGCSVLPRPRTGAPSSRVFTTRVLLHGQPLDLHVSAPLAPTATNVIVLYATGDGGWFGAAVEMFRQIAGAGYPVVGFSSRTFLGISRPRGALATAAQLAEEYEAIVRQARVALGFDDTSRVLLTGWSRGAAFSVLVASEPQVRSRLLGVIAIGLDEGEDLQVSDASDDGPARREIHRWPFDNYTRIAALDPFPCAVIQATGDEYFPAGSARQRFGSDTPVRRFYAIEARNHRFSGGKPAFHAALLDALRWTVSGSDPKD